VDASNGTPVVGGVSDNPVRAGIALALARPGMIFTTVDVTAKRLGQLHAGALASRPRPQQLARRHDALRLLLDQQGLGHALDRGGEAQPGIPVPTIAAGWALIAASWMGH
jgi:hypothetical protein